MTHLFSLKAVVVAGISVATLPLFAALALALAAQRDTAATGRDMNRQVYAQTNAVRSVLQKTADIERKARWFVLLSDPALRRPHERKSYEAVRDLFRQSLQGLQGVGMDSKVVLLADVLSEKEDLIYQQIIASDADNHPRLPVEEAFVGLREASNTLSREFDAYVAGEFNTLGLQSKTEEAALLQQAGGLAGLSFALLAALSALLARLMNRLESAIQQLGSGDLAEPIRMAGPSDLKRMGADLESLRLLLNQAEPAGKVAATDRPPAVPEDAGEAIQLLTDLPLAEKA